MSKPSLAAVGAPARFGRRLHWAIPMFVLVTHGLILTLICTEALESYGFSLFVALPFGLGTAAAWLDNQTPRPTLGRSLCVANITVACIAISLVLLVREGIVCIVMAAPLWLACASIGGVVGWATRGIWLGPRSRTVGSVAILALVPALAGAERLVLPAPTPFQVVSSVEIAASPDCVWRNVISFPPLPPPKDWLFQAGVAYPLRATIQGVGVGAVRRCCFSTGDFVEPIVVWDAPRRLLFNVTHNPPPLREWTPFSEVHPPHLDGFLVAQKGEFRLTPLGGGRTRLDGTTWYQHGLWPEWYWRIYSDYIIHRIHMRVLEHIRANSEAAAGKME